MFAMNCNRRVMVSAILLRATQIYGGQTEGQLSTSPQSAIEVVGRCS
jgi:hypothetical protein